MNHQHNNSSLGYRVTSWDRNLTTHHLDFGFIHEIEHYGKTYQSSVLSIGAEE